MTVRRNDDDNEEAQGGAFTPVADGRIELAAVGDATVALQTPGQPAPPVRADLIRAPARHNPRLQDILRRVNADTELHTLWEVANVNGQTRLGMSDHGAVHVQVVANIALRLLRILADAGRTPNVVRDYGLALADAEVVVVLAALFHDIGMVISRPEHERYSLIVAAPRVQHLLADSYGVRERAILWSEVLHAILVHSEGYRPISLEAGIVRVADALDMTKGRSRIPYDAGNVNIHSLSAAAIERVTITRGTEKPVAIAITMNNSAGVFQIDELLRAKVLGSGLEDDLEITASVEGETERKLLTMFRL